MLSYCSITVTNSRVYGKTIFRRRVDLPLDSVTAVGTFAFGGTSVSTSSGKFRFFAVDKRDEIYQTISKLLLERTQKESNNTKDKIVESTAPDEILKYKELLDDGLITEKEFNNKKKQSL